MTAKKPVIGYLRNLDDCIKALNNIRAYFASPEVVPATTPASGGRFLTDAQIAALANGTSTTTTITISGDLTDVGGSGKQARIQVRFMGLNPDGSDMWQFEVVSV